MSFLRANLDVRKSGYKKAVLPAKRLDLCQLIHRAVRKVSSRELVGESPTSLHHKVGSVRPQHPMQVTRVTTKLENIRETTRVLLVCWQ
jgi:hypothetical protein